MQARAFLKHWSGPRPSNSDDQWIRSGWLLHEIERLFWLLRFLSIGYLVRTVVSFPGSLTGEERSVESKGAEARAVDAYVLISLGALMAALILAAVDSSILRGIAAGFTLYFLAEIVLSTGNVVLFDHLRGELAVASVQRSILLGLINIFQVIIGFATLIAVLIPGIVLKVEGDTFQLSDISPTVWASFKVATFSEAPEGLTSFQWILPAAETLIVIWLLVILVGWAIGALPQRSGPNG